MDFLLPTLLFCIFPAFGEISEPIYTQDVLIHGQIHAKGQYDCGKRYQLLHELLESYKRPFTMITLGAKEGYYSFRGAEEFPKSSFIMTEEGDGAKKLYSLIEKNSHLNNIVLLDTHLILKDLKLLIKSNHFDVALFLIPEKYHSRGKLSDLVRFYNMLVSLASHVIVEVPEALVEHHKILKKFSKCYKEIPLFSPNSTLYFLSPKEISITQTYPFGPSHELEILASKEHLYAIESLPYHQIRLSYSFPIGLNFVTFKLLNGVYPNEEIQEEIINDALWFLHPSSMPWHLFIQGTKGELHSPPSCFTYKTEGDVLLEQFLKNPRDFRKNN